MTTRSFSRLILCLLPLSWLVLLLYNLLQYAFVAPVSFDGAMNMNTAVSVASGSGYGLFYDAFFPFPAQTDGPFILPAALLVSAFGITPLVTQATNLVYLVVLIPLLVVLLKRLGLPTWAAFLGTFAAMSVPGFSEYGMNGYGEIPAFTWYLGGLLAFGTALNSAQPRRAALLAGVLLALAYLTKVVALVLVGPVVAVAVALALRQQLSRGTFLRLCMGFIIPIILWEVYRLFSVGSLHGFGNWWRLQLGQVIQQSGVAHGVVNIRSKLAEHFLILSSITGLNGFLLISFLVLPPLLYIYIRNSCTIGDRFYIVCLLLSGLVYFLWWLLLTPTSMAWSRRIIDGVIIHQILLFAIAYRAIFLVQGATGGGWFIRRGALSLVAVALLSGFALVRNGQGISKAVDPPAYAASFFELASDLRSLPEDAVIFGTGWWQSPGLALYSGRKLHNFQHWMPDDINNLKHKYLVFDPFSLAIAKPEVLSVLALNDTVEIRKSAGGELYRLDHARRYAPLEVAIADLVKLRSEMDFSVEDYDFKRGFYPIEDKKYAWMRTDGLVILGRTAERRLVVSLIVPAQLIAEKPIRLRVKVPACGEQTFSLSHPWETSVELTLDCPASRQRTPLYVYLHVDRPMPFVRQLDADNRLLGVPIRYVRLAN